MQAPATQRASSRGRRAIPPGIPACFPRRHRRTPPPKRMATVASPHPPPPAHRTTYARKGGRLKGSRSHTLSRACRGKRLMQAPAPYSALSRGGSRHAGRASPRRRRANPPPKAWPPHTRPFCRPCVPCTTPPCKGQGSWTAPRTVRQCAHAPAPSPCGYCPAVPSGAACARRSVMKCTSAVVPSRRGSPSQPTPCDVSR